MNQSPYKKIGDYRFYSQEEYKEGLNDLKKVKTLMGKGDLTNPKLATKLYQQLLTYPDMFESLIGEEFIGKLLHCANGHPERLDSFFSSIFLDYSSQVKSEPITRSHVTKNDITDVAVPKRMAEESIIQAKPSKPVKVRSSKKKRFGKREVSIFMAGMLTFFLIYTVGEAIHYKVVTDRSVKKFEALAECVLDPVNAMVSDQHKELDELVNLENNNLFDDEVTELLSLYNEQGVLYQYSELYEMNSDMVGWISIEGTVIHYPVMQTKDDEEFYLNRDFAMEDDIMGLPFMDARCDIVMPSSNFLIHSHNMKSGDMFASLLNYKQEEYYKEHKIIQFDTIYETAQYEIVSAFLTSIPYQHEDVFRYYNFINAETKEEYDQYIKEVKSISYYDTGVVPEYGEGLITLSTCDRSIEDGRFVIVARKITDTD